MPNAMFRPSITVASPFISALMGQAAAKGWTTSGAPKPPTLCCSTKCRSHRLLSAHRRLRGTAVVAGEPRSSHVARNPGFSAGWRFIGMQAPRKLRHPADREMLKWERMT